MSDIDFDLPTEDDDALERWTAAMEQAEGEMPKDAGVDEVFERSLRLLRDPDAKAKPKDESPPLVATTPESGEIAEGVARLEEFDPDDRQSVLDQMESLDEKSDEYAALALRLEQMDGRGQFAAVLDSQLEERITTARDEAALLDNEISQARTTRERKELEAKYADVVTSRIAAEDELKLRAKDRQYDVGLKAQAAMLAHDQILNERRDAFTKAQGWNPKDDELQNKPRPTRAAPAVIQQAEYDLTQPITDEEIAERSPRILEQLRKDYAAAQVAGWRAHQTKDDSEQWRHSFTLRS